MDNVIRIGIGGPVGSGKSHLLLRLCELLREERSIVAVTNDIYTTEDAEFLRRRSALTSGRIVGVETGGCPHAAVRDDISLNMNALIDLSGSFPDARLAFIESGGDNLSATFSPDLADYQIYVIDVAQGGDIPRKGGLGIAHSDLLVVNKIDLAPYVEVDMDRMRADVTASRGDKPTEYTNLKKGTGVEAIASWVRSLPAIDRSKDSDRTTPARGEKHSHDHHHGELHGHSHAHAHDHVHPR